MFNSFVKDHFLSASGVKEPLREFPDTVKFSDNQAIKPSAGGCSTCIYCKCKYNKHDGGMYQ
jgi:hypothetical protein